MRFAVPMLDPSTILEAKEALTAKQGVDWLLFLLLYVDREVRVEFMKTLLPHLEDAEKPLRDAMNQSCIDTAICPICTDRKERYGQACVSCSQQALETASLNSAFMKLVQGFMEAPAQEV